MSDLTLQIAASGIDAEEAELNTAANNLANVSTPGYAREVVNQANIGATGTDGAGSGVLITSITEDGSSLYDQLNELAQGQLAAANESVSVQDLAQDAFPTATGTGLSSELSTLWTDFSTLATEPSNSAAQQSVVQAAGNVASTLNSTSAQLSSVGAQLQDDLGGSSTGYVGQANQLITEIAQINGQLAGLTTGSNSSGGLNLNSLTDEQRADAATLAGLVGSTSTISSTGTMTVSVAGIQLVSGSVATSLQTAGTAGGGDLAVETAQGDVVPAGGTVGSLLTGVNTAIPGYQSSLDSIADSLATSLNSLQAGGVSASGVPGPDAASASGYTGTTLPSIFVNDESSTAYTTGSGSAATISINPTLAADPSLIATAAGTATAGQSTIDPTTAQAMAAVGNSATGPDSLYQSLVGLVGTQTSQATNTQTSAQALADSTSSEQSSVEGVNTNDETVNMLAAQQNYQALASVISSTTSALEALLTAVD
jgi:flagellar hook-associated protein 1 FlgK